MPSTEKQKIRARLRSYERKLQKEKKEHGFYRDGAGKRYQIGPHYNGTSGYCADTRATSRLIRVAAQAAPKPLSILTTVTPAAQLFSIVSSAATPPNDAP